jgi:hypothetical protein
VNDTDTTTRVNVARLLDLGRWLTREERARRLGLPSHWNQSVWVVTGIDDIDADAELPIEVVGVPGGEQPVFVNWSCGTAACAAGHISIEDGGSPAFTYAGETSPVPPPTNEPWDWLDALSSHSMYFGGRLETIEEHARETSPVPPPTNEPWDWLDALSSHSMYFGGRLETIEEHAREVLGLSAHEANQLFEGNNTWDSMVYVISDLTGIPEHELLVQIGAEDMPVDPDAEAEYDDDEDACANGCTCDDD